VPPDARADARGRATRRLQPHVASSSQVAQVALEIVKKLVVLEHKLAVWSRGVAGLVDRSSNRCRARACSCAVVFPPAGIDLVQRMVGTASSGSGRSIFQIEFPGSVRVAFWVAGIAARKAELSERVLMRRSASVAGIVAGIAARKAELSERVLMRRSASMRAGPRPRHDAGFVLDELVRVLDELAVRQEKMQILAQHVWDTQIATRIRWAGLAECVGDVHVGDVQGALRRGVHL
jgi:hypothetical protein